MYFLSGKHSYKDVLEDSLTIHSLKATGVMKAKNPVQVAAQQGRFEELEDDADSD